ncbi:MAG: HlyD family efflux transporter periplasmic adaptor subunit [Burkholderiaceae bacterium]
MAGSVGRADGAARRNLILEQLARELAAIDSERDELDRLSLRAPFAGRLVDRDHQVGAGTWVSARQPLAILIDPAQWVVDALVSQEDVARVSSGARARFYLRNVLDEAIHGTVEAVESVRLQSLPEPLLADVAGGRVATLRQPDGRLVPRASLYRVRIALDRPAGERVNADLRLRTGTAHIEASRRSLLGDWLTNLAAVIVRESGF